MNNVKITSSMEYPTGPPSSINKHISKLRCRKMKWQTEGNWHWSIVFSDRMADSTPSYIDPYGTFAMFQPTNFGNNIHAQGPNGPNE